MLTGALEEIKDLYPNKRKTTVRIIRYLLTGLVIFKEKTLYFAYRTVYVALKTFGKYLEKKTYFF